MTSRSHCPRCRSGSRMAADLLASLFGDILPMSTMPLPLGVRALGCAFPLPFGAALEPCSSFLRP